MARALKFVALLVVLSALLPAGSAEAHHIGPFVGEWRNEDPATQATTRYVVDVSGGELVIRAYGACVPTECDWSQSGGPRRTTQSDADDGRLSYTWEFGFKTQRDDLSLTADGRLRADQFHDYAPGDPRPDRATTEYFVRTSAVRTFVPVSVATNGRGRVTSEPAGLTCPTLCALEFEVGTTVTLRATPARKNRFRGWGGSCSGSSPTCSLTIRGETSVAALFAATPDCLVPRLIRKTFAAAARLLARAHCKLGRVTRSHSAVVPRGRIMRQRPAAGARLRNGAPVAVVVSKGPR